MSETSLVQDILKTATRLGARLFRNNVGKAWQGEARYIKADGMMRVSRGDVLIKKARRVAYGLCVGSSDSIGWTVQEITPDMVGSKIAVFTAVEAKLPGRTARTTGQQFNFIRNVLSAGGIAFIATDTQTVERNLTSPCLIPHPAKSTSKPST